MPKDKKYSLKSNRIQTKKGIKPIFLVIGGAIIVIIASLFVFQNKKEPFTPEIVGSPSLKVDEEYIDLGDIKLGRNVQTSFKVINVGDQELKFTQLPYVEVMEGC